MPLTYKAGASATEYKLVPEGTHIMICYLVADLGLQPGSAKFPNPKQQVHLHFEIPEERIDDKPMVIGKTYTASMNEKANLRKDLVSWRGKDFTDEQAEAFDVSSVLGVACMGVVVHNKVGDKEYANITSISGLPKGFARPKAENPPILFNNDGSDKPGILPEWLQKKVDAQIRAKAPQKQDFAIVDEMPDYNGNFGDQGITDDDIPF